MDNKNNDMGDNVTDTVKRKTEKIKKIMMMMMIMKLFTFCTSV